MEKEYKEYTYLGACPICLRDMYDDNNSVNRHHFLPKSRGGKEQEYAHRVCHDMIHRTWTNKELEKKYSDAELIRADPKMQNFIEWVAKKDPLFYISSKNSVNKKRKKG